MPRLRIHRVLRTMRPRTCGNLILSAADGLKQGGISLLRKDAEFTSIIGIDGAGRSGAAWRALDDPERARQP